MSKQNKYTKSARDENCTVRIPGCPNDTATTVLAHYRLMGTSGMGYKPNDLQGAFCCGWCHDRVDGRAKSELSREELRLYHAEGVLRTVQRQIDKGVLKV